LRPSRAACASIAASKRAMAATSKPAPMAASRIDCWTIISKALALDPLLVGSARPTVPA
jgi:hypothetical protein